MRYLLLFITLMFYSCSDQSQEKPFCLVSSSNPILYEGSIIMHLEKGINYHKECLVLINNDNVCFDCSDVCLDFGHNSGSEINLHHGVSYFGKIILTDNEIMYIGKLDSENIMLSGEILTCDPKYEN